MPIILLKTSFRSGQAVHAIQVDKTEEPSLSGFVRFRDLT